MNVVSGEINILLKILVITYLLMKYRLNYIVELKWDFCFNNFFKIYNYFNIEQDEMLLVSR